MTTNLKFQILRKISTYKKKRVIFELKCSKMSELSACSFSLAILMFPYLILCPLSSIPIEGKGFMHVNIIIMKRIDVRVCYPYIYISICTGQITHQHWVGWSDSGDVQLLHLRFLLKYFIMLVGQKSSALCKFGREE